MAQYVKAKVVANILGKSVRTIYQLRCAGIFPAETCRPRGDYDLIKVMRHVDAGTIYDGKKKIKKAKELLTPLALVG